LIDGETGQMARQGFNGGPKAEKYLVIHLGKTTAWQNEKWTQLDIKTRAILTQWQGSSTSYFLSRPETDNKLVGAKLTHILTILPPPTAFLDTMNKLMVHFIWQGRHWKHQNFVYGRPKIVE
jgi:hypothetical protein